MSATSHSSQRPAVVAPPVARSAPGPGAIRARGRSRRAPSPAPAAPPAPAPRPAKPAGTPAGRARVGLPVCLLFSARRRRTAPSGTPADGAYPPAPESRLALAHQLHNARQRQFELLRLRRERNEKPVLHHPWIHRFGRERNGDDGRPGRVLLDIERQQLQKHPRIPHGVGEPERADVRVRSFELQGEPQFVRREAMRFQARADGGKQASQAGRKAARAA